MANAHPTEWVLRQGAAGAAYAVIRRFAFGDPGRPEIWFRVVTWAATSAGRELIGWCRTLEAAAQVAWDHRCAAESWRHHMASRRVDAAAMAAQRPSAAELVRFYRAAMRRAGAPAPAAPRETVPQPAPQPAPQRAATTRSASSSTASTIPAARSSPAQSAAANASTRSRFSTASMPAATRR